MPRRRGTEALGEPRRKVRGDEGNSRGATSEATGLRETRRKRERERERLWCVCV